MVTSSGGRSSLRDINLSRVVQLCRGTAPSLIHTDLTVLPLQTIHMPFSQLLALLGSVPPPSTARNTRHSNVPHLQEAQGSALCKTEAAMSHVVMPWPRLYRAPTTHGLTLCVRLGGYAQHHFTGHTASKWQNQRLVSVVSKSRGLSHSTGRKVTAHWGL